MSPDATVVVIGRSAFMTSKVRYSMSETKPTTPTADLTLQEVAALKKCSVRTIRRRISEGALPAHRIGPRYVRVKASDINLIDRPIPTVGFAR